MINEKEKKIVMKKTGNYLAILFFILFNHFALAATQTSVRATVGSDKVGIGDPIQLNVMIQSSEDFDQVDIKIPEIKGLQLINSAQGGKSTSSRMSIINGKTEFSKTVMQTYQFTFAASREGEFTIPILDVPISGQLYKTQPIRISVKDAYRNQGSKSKTTRQFPPGFGNDENDPTNPFGDDEDDMFSQLLKEKEKMFDQLRKQMGQQSGGFPGGLSGGGVFGQPAQPAPSRQLNVNTNEAFFIYADIDKTEVYEGEQITANWYIYTRGQIQSLDRAKFPDLKGFWKEIIEEVPNLQFSTEIVNGVPFQKALLASHALFPIKAGTAVIDEFKIKAKVSLPTQFGWGQPREYTKASRRVAIKVLPLPIEGRPKSFSGAVGNFQITAKTEGTSFPANQPFSLKVRFEGQGNAKLIELPAIDWPSQIEIFDTKSESKFYKNGESYKEFEILVIPRKEGPLTIPSISFSYFDPKLKKYIETQSQPIQLTVTASLSLPPAGVNSTMAPTTHQALTSSENIAPILELPKSGFVNSWHQNKPMAYTIILALGLVGILVQFLLKYNRLAGAPQFESKVQARLVRIDSLLNQNDARKLGAEATNLIYLLAVGLAGERGASREWSEIIQQVPPQARSKYLDRMTKVFDYFQIVGFAPEKFMEQIKQENSLAQQVVELKKIAKEVVKEVQSREEKG